MEILGLIPARAGSERIKNKNIKLLNDKPLISYTIASALNSNLLSRLIVSTDSEEIAAMSKSFGAEVPFMRPKGLSTSSSTELEFHEHTLDELFKIDSYKPDLIVNLYPTSPFRKSTSIDLAINHFINNFDYDALRSVVKCTEHPYKMWLKYEERLKPFIKTDNAQEHALSYQLLPEVYIQNACIYISKYETIKDKNSTIGDKVLAFTMDQIEGLDINNPLDFLFAEFLINEGLIEVA